MFFHHFWSAQEDAGDDQNNRKTQITMAWGPKKMAPTSPQQNDTEMAWISCCLIFVPMEFWHSLDAKRNFIKFLELKAESAKTPKKWPPEFQAKVLKKRNIKPERAENTLLLWDEVRAHKKQTNNK